MAGRPSKIPVETWAKAKALYEAGKSLRSIDKETGINYKSVENRVKKEGWKQGILSQQIVEQSRVEVNFLTLLPSQQEVVTKEVDILTGFRKKRNSIANIAYDRIESELQTCEPFFIKQLVEATDKVGVMVEIAPRHQTPAPGVNLQNNIGLTFNIDDRDQNLQRLKKLITGSIIDA